MRQSTGRLLHDDARPERAARVPEPEQPRPISAGEMVCRSCQLIVRGDAPPPAASGARPRDESQAEVILLVCRDCHR